MAEKWTDVLVNTHCPRDKVSDFPMYTPERPHLRNKDHKLVLRDKSRSKDKPETDVLQQSLNPGCNKIKVICK